MSVTENTSPVVDRGTGLAMDRTRMASERTLMAWVRTALSMISFGFSIPKFLQYVHQDPNAAPAMGPRNLGLTMIAFGTSILVMAMWQHRQELRELHATGMKPGRSMAFIVAGILAVMGALAFISVLTRSGPF